MMLYALLAAWLIVTLLILRLKPLPAFLLVLFAAGLYALAGNPQHYAHTKKIEWDIQRYSQILKDSPKNLEAWIGLGSALMENGRYEASAHAFKQSVLLSGGNPLLILAYAKAMIMAKGGEVSADAKKSLEMVLLQDTENPEARYFMAIRKLQEGNVGEAMSDMKTLYRSLPENSPLKATINQQIGRP